MNTPVRREPDSMGPLEVHADRYHAAQTARSLIHFAIGHDLMPKPLLRAFGTLKKACALVNEDLGKLPAKEADLMVRAAEEVIAGKLDDRFPPRVLFVGMSEKRRGPPSFLGHEGEQSQPFHRRKYLEACHIRLGAGESRGWRHARPAPRLKGPRAKFSRKWRNTSAPQSFFEGG